MVNPAKKIQVNLVKRVSSLLFKHFIRIPFFDHIFVFIITALQSLR